MNRLSAVLLFVVLSACASSGSRFQLYPEENAVEVSWSGGKPIAISDVVSSNGQGSRIIISPAASDFAENQRLGFYVGVYNYSTESVEVSPESLEIVNSSGEIVPAITATQRRREIRDAAQAEAFVQSLGAALQAFSTGYQAAIANQSPYATSAQQALERREAQRARAQIQVNANQNIALTGLYFDRTTIYPFERYVSFLDIMPPNSNGQEDKILLTVVVGTDKHVIPFIYLPTL